MQSKAHVLVSVVMGSDSDLPVMEEAVKVLQEFKIPHELFLTSAHRTPERTTAFARGAAGRGVRIIIVGAGAAAHLAGVRRFVFLSSIKVNGEATVDRPYRHDDPPAPEDAYAQSKLVVGDVACEYMPADED